MKSVITKTNDLPKNNGLANAKLESLRFGDLLYCALLSHENDSLIYILCPDQTKSLSIDKNYVSLASQCRSMGYSTKRLFATKELITLLSDDNKANNESSSLNSSPVFAELVSLIEYARKVGSSDIHIEVRASEANIFLRIDGEKSHYKQIIPVDARRIARFAFTSIGKNKDITFDETKPQDAKLSVDLSHETCSLRLATIPEAEGFDMVLRLLPSEAKEQDIKSLEELGYSNENCALLNIANSTPVGVIIVSGVTGSGKSTTLATMVTNSLLESENKVKVITIEDPPEISMKNVTQSPVVRRGSEGKGSFSVNMSASLRCDPDIIMPGEIRDAETARLLVAAAQTGHRVLTTLHAPSGISCIDRLREMGVSSEVLGSSDFISALVYQSLVRKLCQSCAISFNEFTSIEDNVTQLSGVLKRIDNVSIEKRLDKQRVKFRNPQGCSKCNGKGTLGRKVVAEVIVPDAKLRAFFREGNTSGALDYYKSCGGKLILDNGIEALFDGDFDIRDLERKVGMIDMSNLSLDELLAKIRGNVSADKKTDTQLKSSLNINKGRASASVSDIKKDS